MCFSEILSIIIYGTSKKPIKFFKQQVLKMYTVTQKTFFLLICGLAKCPGYGYNVGFDHISLFWISINRNFELQRAFGLQK